MIATLPFGRTGHRSTRTLFGAAAIRDCDQATADRVLETLLRHGVNHIDTAPRYGNAELRIGPWMAEHRRRFFLATKTRERTYAGAREELHRSLERLRVERIDLLQMHNLADPAEWDVAMGPGGALEALIEARDEGLVRFLGVTGHGLGIAATHLRSLERFDFDSVLLPCNYALMQNAPYRADFEAVVKVCRERNVAVQTIKSIARGQWGETARNRGTWYAPLEHPAAIERAVHYVLGQEGLFLNTAGDIHLLELVLDAASRYQGPPPDAALAADQASQGITQLFTETFSGP